MKLLIGVRILFQHINYTSQPQGGTKLVVQLRHDVSSPEGSFMGHPKVPHEWLALKERGSNRNPLDQLELKLISAGQNFGE